MADGTPFDELEPELLDRYLAGECSAEEMAQMRRWLAAHPEASHRLETFLGEIGGIRRPGPPNVSASWRAIRGRMRTPESVASAEPERRPRLRPVSDQPRRTRIDWRWSVATALACIAVIAGVSYVASRVQPPVSPPLRRSHATAGERVEFRLPDGSRVRLAPRSRLRAATDFGAERRDVFLEGEAFFDVSPDDVRAFTVFAGNASVRAVGASFDVRAYARDSAVVVIVRDGTVAVSGVGRLAEGDLGRISDGGETQVQHRIALDSALAWLR